MKKLFFSLVLLLNVCILYAAKTYYVSATSGNDNNSGTSSSAPWRTLSKLNSFFSSLQPGDKVLLNRGDVFYGSITASASGSSGSPITISAYGSGAKPVITGFTTVSSWTNLGSNIWESSNAVSSLQYTNMVSVNGANTPMGRYPNTGYFTISAVNGTTSLTSSSLTGPNNWAGASIVTRKERWILERGTINSQSGTTLNYTDGNFSNAKVGYGFFIENDSRTLDTSGEWYYNPSTKKLRVYSTSSPSSVRIATIENLIYINAYSYITIDNLNITGANTDAVSLNNHSSNITVQNCDVAFTGLNGVDSHDVTNVNVQNNTFTYVNYNGVGLFGASHYGTVVNNILKSINVLPGMDQTIPGGGITTMGDNTLIQYNELDSCGYNGIFPRGNNSNIKNNLVNTFCFMKDDGAGVYCVSSGITGRVIDGNIILNGIGANVGTGSTDQELAGIFMDDNASYVTITNNTVANVSTVGIKLHDAYNIVIRNNTCYNNGGTSWQNAAYELLYDPSAPVRNCSIYSNIFFAKTASQLTMFTYTSSTNPLDILNIGLADSNYYVRPMSDANQMNYQSAGITWPGDWFNITSWSTFFGQEKHSKGSPKSVNSTDSLNFVYNASTSSQTFALDANYIDAKGVNYNGTITLAPYNSAVLIRNGNTTKSVPIANAGADITVTLPTNSTTLNGSATETNGTIKNYAWTKVSGPAATIASPTSATTSATSLVQGIYLFQLKVTDNKSISDLDTVQVRVNAAQTGSNGLNYRYFAGAQTSYSYTSAYNYLVPDKTGITSNYDLSVAPSTTQFSMDFTGYIQIATSGTYTFYTSSDDGSTLSIDGSLVVNNGNLHSVQEMSGSVYLSAGMHSIAVGYFQNWGGEVLNVSYQGPSVSKQLIPSAVLFTNASGANGGSSFSGNEQLITNNSEAGIKVFPNPFINSFQINFKGISTGETKLLLYNASGQLVWNKIINISSSAYSETIDASAFPRGSYFLKIAQATASTTIKLVK